MKFSRRNLLIGAGLVAGGGWLMRPSDMGGSHSAYFNQLSNALSKVGITKPTMVVDKQKLRTNIQQLSDHINSSFDYRIVAKSLPSLDLIDYVATQSGTNRYMLFHEPFIRQLVARHPDADVLMGKPMPIAAVQQFYASAEAQAYRHEEQLQWLIDSEQRAAQYTEFARQQKIVLQCNIEIDVGLHRGGIASDESLVKVLRAIAVEPYLAFSGFMGYEPHVVKVPGGAENNLAKSLDIYRRYIGLAKQELGEAYPKSITLNAAGSPTYRLHTKENSPANELSAGSCLVKPLDFDTESLAVHEPACFIATPVVKHLQQTEIPGVSGLGEIMAAWDPNRRQAFFTYGGNWKAEPVSPPGLSINPIYGRSSNQEMLNGSRSVRLAMDEWVFYRPTQSEAVMLQFGDIAVYDQGVIVETWPIFSA